MGVKEGERRIGVGGGGRGGGGCCCYCRLIIIYMCTV